jgi:pantoate--beta-alanine ligase
MSTSLRSLSTVSGIINSKLTLHRTVEAMRAARFEIGSQNQQQQQHGHQHSANPSITSIGFVPTMGALHEGHASLVREARCQNDIVICSIFVNPIQFAPNGDLDRYPRQLEKDMEILESLGVDHLFAPTDPTQLYGPHHVTYVDPIGFDDLPEGRCRPGHFRGVATIVTKLFNIIQPTRAYFGQKDAAQCCLIKRIVQDLNIPIEICIQDTLRESDGLAMSSRNVYLSSSERKAATILYRSLCAAQAIWKHKVQDNPYDVHLTSNNNMVKSVCLAEDIRQAVLEILQQEPLVSDIQYIAIDNRETMQPLDTVGIEGAVVSLAAQVGSVRLIDNIVLE